MIIGPGARPTRRVAAGPLDDHGRYAARRSTAALRRAAVRRAAVRRAAVRRAAALPTAGLVAALLTLALPAPARAAVDDVTRDGARREAERELSRSVYRDQEPGLFVRGVLAVLRALDRVLDGATGLAPGGGPGLFALLVLVVATFVVVRRQTGPLARASRSRDLLDRDPSLTADDHRRRAEAAAAAGEWAEALRERLRAVVRELEARGVLAVRPGRTARETAEEGARSAPALGADLRRAAFAFDEVWYGGRPGTPEAYALVRGLDERLQGRRPALLRDGG